MKKKKRKKHSKYMCFLFTYKFILIACPNLKYNYSAKLKIKMLQPYKKNVEKKS